MRPKTISTSTLMLIEFPDTGNQYALVYDPTKNSSTARVTVSRVATENSEVLLSAVDDWYGISDATVGAEFDNIQRQV